VYETTKVAGSIVPAISTTNAMVAGAQINEFLKVLICNPETLDRKYRNVNQTIYKTTYFSS